MERGTNMEEARRWLVTAEKLLAARDLHGTKSFAIRAREANPSLRDAEVLIHIADVLLASEFRINNHPDWYAVLQLPRFTHDWTTISDSYRRIALKVGYRGGVFPYADEASRIVCEAWNVLSDHPRRNFFDNELNSYSQFGFGLGTGSAQLFERQFLIRHQHHPPPPSLKQQSQPSPPPPPPPPSPPPQAQAQSQAQSEAQVQAQPQAEERARAQAQPQQQQPVRRSPRKKGGKVAEEERPNLNNVAELTRSTRHSEATRSARKTETIRSTRQAGSTRVAGTDERSFWTACPYCYILYEYQKVYEECVLRCQNCKRAFQAVKISSPPVKGNDDTYFCCWGFFPLGYSGNAKDTNVSAGWTPFSPIFACPIATGGKPKEGDAKKPSSPKFIYREDDIYVEVSDETDESDDEWQCDKGSKRARNSKGKAFVAKTAKRTHIERGRRGNENVNATIGEALDGAVGTSKGPCMEEPSKKIKAAAGGAKKKEAAEWGKLDLNVEFSNDVEEPAQGANNGNGLGNGEEDNIEGIEFFEGLDEFLSSLPILNVVGDDKVETS